VCSAAVSVTLYYILCVFLYLYGTHVPSFGNYIVTFLISMTALNYFSPKMVVFSIIRNFVVGYWLTLFLSASIIHDEEVCT
jgi:hypothetical protein